MECPVCGNNKGAGLVMKNLQNHVVRRAKHELWCREIFGNESTPHLDYIKAHAKITVSEPKLFIIKPPTCQA